MPVWRFAVLAGLAGTAVGVALTWPLARHPATTVLDDGTLDAYQFLWNLWWVRESVVSLHTNPFFTRYLYYPVGTSLLFHTLSASLGLASIPLQLLLPGGLVTAHNVLVIAAPALLVVTTALLAREVTGDAWAALAAGLMAALTGAVVWFVPIVYFTASYLIAAVLWAWWRMNRLGRARDGVLVLGLLAALVFASQEYAMMALAVLALDTVARVAAGRRLGFPHVRIRAMAIAWAVTAAGLGALAFAASRNPAFPPPESHVLLASGFLAGFVTPPWLVRPIVPFWVVLYLGTAPLLLVATTVWLGGRRAAFWTLVAAATVLMACGPFVGVDHPMLADPDGPHGLAHTPAGHVPGPYLLAMHAFPLLRFFRAPYRWIAVVEIVVATLAAVGIAGLRARLAPGAVRGAVTAAILVAIVGLGALDVRGLGNAAVPAVVPDAYATIRDDPEPAAVLELPTGLAASLFGNLASRYMFFQTSHRKYLLDGTVARLPRGVFLLVSRPITDFAALPWVKYVVIHRDLMDAALPVARAQVAQVEALLPAHATLVRADGPIEIYRLATFRPETVR
jgi:hypothetical protein